MIAVIFEFRPRPEHRQAYLDHAERLREELSHQRGFISVERFESLTEPGKMVSISFWESEEAVAAWRNHPAHRQAQAAGRREIFEDYRLRVAEVVRDYGLRDRAGAPEDSRQAHDA